MRGPDGGLQEIALPFELEQQELQVQFGLTAIGLLAMTALLHVVVEPLG